MEKTIRVYGLETRVWTVRDGSYGCAECCNGDRCDEDCDAKYKGRRSQCPHCKGKGWIPVTDTEEETTTEVVHVIKESDR